MEQEYEHLSNEENLKAENEFLKMKMMLEQGALFGKGTAGADLPAEIENQFLQNIMAFEMQSANPTYIKLFDKIGRPAHFKAVTEIADNAFDEAWDELCDYLRRYNIILNVCSPNISTKELYRFTIEELFDHEMEDMDVPGMMSCFTYDEFHPDPYYENAEAATNECIRNILQQDPMEWTHHFRKENLRLNNHYPITEEELKAIVNQFKAAYESIEITILKDTACIVDENKSTVDGIYEIAATTGSEAIQLPGTWQVSFEKDEDLGYWYINGVVIKGINF